MNKLHHIIEQQSQRQALAPAIFWQDKSISYQDLQDNINQCITAIEACTQPGDLVGILALNSPEYIELMYAVPAANRILVPLNTRFSSIALSQQIQSLDIEFLLGDAALVNALKLDASVHCISLENYQQWIDTHQTMESSSEKLNCTDDCALPAWLMFTSGTTGQAKAACLTHQSILAGLDSANYGRPVLDKDRYLYPFPLFHIAAHNVLHQHLHGAAVALLPSFDAAAVLEICQTKSITTLSLAPTMIAMLLDHPDFDADKLQSVRTIGYGASAISPTLLNRVLEQTSCGLSQGFGMTELSGTAAFLDAEGHRLAASEKPQLLKSVGKPVPSVELKIIDESKRPVVTGESGEIIIRGAQVINSYWKDPEATNASIIDGWLYTGDIGKFDNEGYLYIVDRKKDIIVSGGENIASREVESVLCQFKDVKQAAVVGLPDSKWGESVFALVEGAEGAKLEGQVLIDFCKQQLASYKAPKRIVFGPLPLNASGKVDKKAVREIVSA